MVSPSLARRLRAQRGRLVLGSAWMACALATAWWFEVSPPAERAIAVVDTPSWNLLAPYSGRVTELQVTPGATVEAGTVLATVEEPGLAQGIAAAELELRALEAKIGVELDDHDRKFARDLDAARTRWLAARVDLERARAQLAGLDTQLKRLEMPGIELAGAQTDLVRTARAEARAQVDAGAAEVEALERAYTGAEKRAHGKAPAEGLRAEVEAAAVELEALRARRAASQLVAPNRGVVGVPRAIVGRDGRETAQSEATFPAVGLWIEAGTPLLSVTAPLAEDAVVYIPPERARRIATGTRIALASEDGNDLEGAVRAVGAAVERVPLDQLRAPDRPEWGVPVTVRLAEARTPGERLALSLPR